MWKKMLLTLSVVMCMFVSTSCSDNDNNSNAKISNYNPDEKCTISISWWGGDERHEATIKAIEVFENRYPNINVEVDYGDWTGWKNKIFEDIQNGTATDVIQVNYDWLVDLSYDGSGLFDLNALSDYIDLSNFDDDVLNFGIRNNVLNAIPASITGRSLFYNKSVYDEVGVDLPKTWNDLFEIAPKFNEIQSYPIHVDNDTGFTAWYLCIVYEQQKTGKEFITTDDEIGFTVEEIADALQFYKDLQDNGVIRSIQQIKAQDTEESLYDCNAWKNGIIGGITEWGSSVAKCQATLENPDDLVLGDLLTMDNAQSTGWFYKPSLLFAINKDTEYPVQSAMLLDFLYNDPESAEILGTTRGVPISKSAVQALESKNMLNGLAYDSTVQILESNPILISSYMENSELQRYYNETIEAVSLGLLTPQDAAQGIYTNIMYTLHNLKEGK